MNTGMNVVSLFSNTDPTCRQLLFFVYRGVACDTNAFHQMVQRKNKQEMLSEPSNSWFDHIHECFCGSLVLFSKNM
jgi:hypothetical protein